MGRKKKYNEDTTFVGVFLPQTLKQIIDEKAYQNRVSRSEYIVNALISHDPELTKKLISEMNKLRELISRLQVENKNLNGELKRAKKLGASYFFELPELPEEAREVIKNEMPRIKTRLQQAYDPTQRNQILQDEAKFLTRQVEVELAKQGKGVKSKTLIERAILKQLASI